jgi:predicted N-acyltransferase
MWARTLAWSSRTLSSWPWKAGKTRSPDRGAREREGTGNRLTPRYRTTILPSIRDIDADAWDALSGPDAVVRSHAYLEAIEASAINDCRYFYPLILNEDDEIAAHACVYTITTDFAQLLPAQLQRLARSIRRLWPRFLRVKITECGSPLVAEHSVSVRRGEDRERLIMELGEAVSEIARAQRSRLVVIRDFLDSDRNEWDALLRQGYNLASSIPLARIRVRWDSYESYLSCMRSRYRKDVRRRLKRAREDGQQIKILSSFGEQAELWVEQARVIYENKIGFKREMLTPEYYRNMDDRLGDRSMLLVAQKDGRMLAHGMVLADDSNTIATYFGRDSGPASKEWFHLINEAIRFGIDRKSRYINLGRGSYDAKSIVGADVEPLYAYSKSTIAPVNWLMRLIPRTMDQPVEKPRRIFRD